MFFMVDTKQEDTPKEVPESQIPAATSTEKTTLEPAKKVRKRNPSTPITYDDFIKLPRSLHYFPNQEPEEYLKMVPDIKRFVFLQLRERPHTEGELFRKLKKYDVSLRAALDYITNQADFEDEDFGKFRKALNTLTEGIEIRYTAKKCYWGLSSKLDRA